MFLHHSKMLSSLRSERKIVKTLTNTNVKRIIRLMKLLCQYFFDILTQTVDMLTFFLIKKKKCE